MIRRVRAVLVCNCFVNSWAMRAALRSQTSRRSFALFLAALLLPTFTLMAAAKSAERAPLATIDSIRIGFAGHYKVGFWTPIDISLTGGARSGAKEIGPVDLQVIVPDGDGVPTATIDRGIALAAGKATHVRACVKIGRPSPAITIVVTAARGSNEKVERTFSGDAVPMALSASRRLILELGGPLNLGSVARFNEEGQPEDSIVSVVDDPTSLPSESLAYDGVDIAVLTTADPSFYDRAPRSALAAMHRWVRLGGRLLLSVGTNGPELLAAGKPLEQFAPGQFVATVQLGQFESLENFAGASQRLFDQAAAGERPTLPVARLGNVRGVSEASEGSGADTLPLVVRSADAFGELIYIGVDLKSSALEHWQALPQLLAALLGRSIAEGQSLPAASGASHLGYNDMSGQLRAALDQFPAARPTPFWLIAILAAGYVLLLFPVDFLLKRHRRASADARSAVSGSAVWPWFSFCVIVVGVSLGAWWLARQSHGDQVQINQADVIDFDVGSGLARGTTWFNLFSPESAQFSISLRPTWQGAHAQTSEARLSWLGVPGNALGAMGDGDFASGGGFSAGAAADLPLFTQPYTSSTNVVGGHTAVGRSAVNSDATVESVPIAAASSKSFTGHWINQSASLVAASLQERSDHQLAGTIRISRNEPSPAEDNQTNDQTQPHNAGQGAGRDEFRLAECVLIHDHWAYLIPHFSPSEPIDVASLDPETADTYFTRRKLVGDQVQTPTYDRAGTDRSRILEIMMFYRAAGGLEYVGLLNRYQHFLDLSDQLGLDRAILIGIGPPASEVTIDGHPVATTASADHFAYYRFLLPVRAADNAGQTTAGASAP